jgi:hypothetical protein
MYKTVDPGLSHVNLGDVFSRTGTLYREPLRGAACSIFAGLNIAKTEQARVPVLPNLTPNLRVESAGVGRVFQ